ncbi:hypothetical protein DFP73DRAFT_550116 [Morchella snyderi]|nr:hypothetical protein DFP73DRAFT_550116 [Morchella snyderi]
MNHSLSLASRQDTGATRSSHKRRHSLSRSLAKGGRRMSGWVAKVYSSSPRRLPPPTLLPPLPSRYPQNPRLSILSFSTPAFGVHILPTPPPSPPVSVNSLETEFTKLEMDKGRKTNAARDMKENSYVPTRVDLIPSMISAAPEQPSAKPLRRFAGLQSPTLCPSFSFSQTSPKSQMDKPAFLPTPPESHAGSRGSTPPMLPEELVDPSQIPSPPRPHTAQTAAPFSTPAPSNNQAFPQTPKRSASVNLVDSFTLIGRRRRAANPTIPTIPPLILNIPPAITTTPSSKPNVLRRRSTTSPIAPPVPPRHLRGLEIPITTQKVTVPHVLPELRFSTSPLMPSPLNLAAASSPLRRGGLRSPGSPVRTGAVRGLRMERRSLLLQPSEQENRMFTKANTERLQLQSEDDEELNAGELHSNLALTDVDQKMKSWDSFPGVHSNMEPPSPISPERDFPTRSSSLLSSPVTPDRFRRLEVPQHLEMAHAAPRQAVLVHIGRGVIGILKSPPGSSRESPEVAADSQSVISTRTIDVDVAFSSMSGLGSGGIWRKIGVYLEQWDLARLLRVSKRIKRAIEPLLYETIWLRPKPPHGYSFSYLSRLLKSIHNKANKPKLQKWTKNIRLGMGFEENQTSLMDHDYFLPEEAILGENGKVTISRNRVSELIEDEGLDSDGGFNGINGFLSDILESTPGLKTFSLDSPVPMNNQSLLALGGINSVTTLKLNLSQPMRKKRQQQGANTPDWEALSKYRPSILLLCNLPLVELRLNNLPTRGGTYWLQVWSTIISLSDTLRILELAMPRIDQKRYGQLFDPYHRVSDLPNSAEDIKTPPTLDWQVYKQAMSPLMQDRKKKLKLHTLQLTGFIVDTELISHEIEPGCLKTLELIGCMEHKKFNFTEQCWKGLEVFRSSGLGFIEITIDAFFTIPGGNKKELTFLTDVCERCERIPLSKLRAVVLDAFPFYGHKIERLGLKEQWVLNTDDLNKVFADVHNGGQGFTELALALVNTPIAWSIFLNGLKRCKNIRRVQVLNGFFHDENSGYRGNVQDGGPRRRVYDDALTIARNLFDAHSEGLPIQLDGIIIAVSQCAWRVGHSGGKWGIVRIRGLLKRSAVGCEELQFT